MNGIRKSNLRLLVIASFVICALMPAGTTRADVKLTDSDRVLFFSATPLWPASFGMRAETFLRVRYPALKTRFWHWSAPNDATTVEGRARLQEHLDAFHPTMVVLNFGLFDGRKEGLRPSRLGQFRGDLIDLVDFCEKAGARVMLVTPSYPEAHRKQQLEKADYDQVVASYAEEVRKIGAERQLPVVDWYAAVADYAQHMPKGAESEIKLTVDGLVPEPISTAIAAVKFLEAIGAEPFNVELTVDWQGLETSTTVGSMSATRAGTDGVRLEMSGLPIPWCVSARGQRVQPAFPRSPMCRFILRVENAPSANLSIVRPGGKAVALPAGAMAEGIDLAMLPEVFHAKPVMDLLGWVKVKNLTLTRFERLDSQLRPEPEYKEANRKYAEAMVAEIEAADRVTDRMPRAMSVTLELRAGAAQR